MLSRNPQSRHPLKVPNKAVIKTYIHLRSNFFMAFSLSFYAHRRWIEQVVWEFRNCRTYGLILAFFEMKLSEPWKSGHFSCIHSHIFRPDAQITSQAWRHPHWPPAQSKVFYLFHCNRWVLDFVSPIQQSPAMLRRAYSSHRSKSDNTESLFCKAKISSEWKIKLLVQIGKRSRFNG